MQDISTEKRAGQEEADFYCLFDTVWGCWQLPCAFQGASLYGVYFPGLKPSVLLPFEA